MPPLAELYPFIAALIVGGIVAGFLAGLFGIGGGAVLVPVFYQMLGVLGVDESVKMHLAVGTSLAIIVPTSLQSFRKHYSRGAVDLELLKSFIVAVPIGVICASIVTAYISGVGLRVIFAILSLFIALKLLFAKSSWKLGDDIPGNPVRGFIGWCIGFFSTFMGVGGGVFNNTFMTLFNREMLQSVATSSGVGVLISVPGVLGYLWAGWGVEGLPPMSIGYVNLIMVAMVIPITLVMAPFGVKAAHILSRRQLEVGFGLFLMLVSARFFISII
ncbi:MAG: sulfite exporter TauE/SafE family protein [Salaquimonas sp.]